MDIYVNIYANVNTPMKHVNYSLGLFTCKSFNEHFPQLRVNFCQLKRIHIGEGHFLGHSGRDINSMLVNFPDFGGNRGEVLITVRFFSTHDGLVECLELMLEL